MEKCRMAEPSMALMVKPPDRRSKPAHYGGQHTTVTSRTTVANVITVTKGL